MLLDLLLDELFDLCLDELLDFRLDELLDLRLDELLDLLIDELLDLRLLLLSFFQSLSYRSLLLRLLYLSSSLFLCSLPDLADIPSASLLPFSS